MLKSKIQDDFMKAYKAKDTLTAETLKMIKSAIQYKEVDLKVKNKELTDQDVLDILKNEQKKHKESIAQYLDANRKESAKKEEQEMQIIQKYLPDMMPFENVFAAVKELFKTMDEKDVNFGFMMKEAVASLKGKAESSDIKKAVDQVIKEISTPKELL